MRFLAKILSAFGIFLLLAVCVQAETISPKEAPYYAGSSVTVEGVVSEVATSRGTTFINFGGRFPNHVFYAVIFRRSSDKFSDLRTLQGMRIAITGTVEFYKGKPQIIVQSPYQIETKN